MAPSQWFGALLLTGLTASLQGGDASSLSAQAAKHICIRSSCEKDVYVAIFYESLSGEWAARCWWQVEPSELTCLADDQGLLESNGTVWYVHAEAPSIDLAFSNSEAVKSAECGGKLLDFYELQTGREVGVLAADFSCGRGVAPPQVLHQQQSPEASARAGGLLVALIPESEVGEAVRHAGRLQADRGTRPGAPPSGVDTARGVLFP